VDVLVAWTGTSGHLLHERWIPSWFRDGLTALITELEAAAPPGLADRRIAFRQQGQAATIKALSPALREKIAMNQLLDLRVELLVGVKLIRAGVLTNFSKETPDFECSWQGNEFGIEVTTRARREAGSAMHDLLEEGLADGPDIGVTLVRSSKLLFSESPAKTAAIADRVVAAIKERVTATAGQQVMGSIPIPELGLTAMLHDAGPVSAPGLRVTYEPPLTDEQQEHHPRKPCWPVSRSIQRAPGLAGGGRPSRQGQWCHLRSRKCMTSRSGPQHRRHPRAAGITCDIYPRPGRPGPCSA
jgi:hypothetical protein